MIKRSGVAEPFSRAKVIEGVRKACQGRPVRSDDLALLAQQVEDALRSSGAAEVGSEDIGKAILGPLKDLDEVAYLRFASVYLAFDSLVDFETAIAALRASAVESAGAHDDLVAGGLDGGGLDGGGLDGGGLAGASAGLGAGPGALSSS